MDDDWLPEEPATAAAYELPEWVRWSGEQAGVPGPLIERSVAVAERRQLDAETPPGQTGPCVVIKASSPLCSDAMRTTVTLDDDLAIRLERHRTQHGESFKQALNEAVRAGLAKLEERGNAEPEVRRTRPLPLGRRLAGSIDNVSEVLAITEGEDYR